MTFSSKRLLQFFFLFSFMVLFCLPARVFAQGQLICIYTSPAGSCWVVPKNSTSKSLLKVGDRVNEGDEIIVARDNAVELALDDQIENIIHIEGEAAVKLSGTSSADTWNIDVSKGKIFALLDKKTIGEKFKITTPNAIAAVRGTQYQVWADSSDSKIYTYKGKVQVNGRKEDGRPTDESVVVKAGKKTTSHRGEAPKNPESMTSDEKRQIDAIRVLVQQSRKAYIDKIRGGETDEKKRGDEKNKEEGLIDRALKEL